MTITSTQPVKTVESLLSEKIIPDDVIVMSSQLLQFTNFELKAFSYKVDVDKDKNWGVWSLKDMGVYRQEGTTE